jgi:HEAT repeat protein
MNLLSLALVLTAPVPPDPPLPEDAQALVKKLTDPDAAKRLDAIHQLGHMARRIDRVVYRRSDWRDLYEPKVKGLVPHLIRAAGDENETNRVAALFALADASDPAGVAVIRERLKDKSQRVRFNAACLLTEFKDASGLDEMKKTLARFRANPKDAEQWEAERLLDAFERITGKNLGKLPVNPAAAPNGEIAAAAEKRYVELYEVWTDWWDWKPGK